jgi:hypothetical protein
MAQATAVKAPVQAEAAAAVAPRQWVCEENPEMRLFLPRISRRPKWRDMNLPEEFAGMYRKGDLFVETERWAKFVGGKYVTSDPAEQAELERIEREGIAPIYEDSVAGLYRCGAHNFTTTSEKAWAAHLRAQHKAGSSPQQLYDVAQDDLGQEQETPYED